MGDSCNSPHKTFGYVRRAELWVQETQELCSVGQVMPLHSHLPSDSIMLQRPSVQPRVMLDKEHHLARGLCRVCLGQESIVVLAQAVESRQARHHCQPMRVVLVAYVGPLPQHFQQRRHQMASFIPLSRASGGKQCLRCSAQ